MTRQRLEVLAATQFAIDRRKRWVILETAHPLRQCVISLRGNDLRHDGCIIGTPILQTRRMTATMGARHNKLISLSVWDSRPRPSCAS